MPLPIGDKKMSHRDVGLLPVCDGERLIGMLTDRDITVRAVAAGREPLTTPVRDVMTPDVVYGWFCRKSPKTGKLSLASH